ncbi:TPA: cytidylyltransferase domain-containing protein [Clostridium botulinum]|uniref:cytidylyltransferase domain-containing protein n=1 Tax=Clostridium botulinum TaxID=1491 RepID=UPI0008FC78A4|nr:glycosyltransferase family protein [Clostridium botulinum]APC79736.1 cytidylyltransferase family protein [Clostridium botulinum]MCS4448391.1 glycosyltransferase family protein [Clostridium botulinum]MCS4458321.1 glycosyltransferase family protein [Clostridium botulinum]MCS4460702.1 glycosyltransferase family protein [Clostridium botulinum]MCS4512905.1 glycosyltransferase family protein [Clostridium botulinum]
MKVICVVQARMGSERLPGKVIKPIMDKPMILYTLNRLNKSKYIDEIILATSIKNKEQPLVDIVEKEGFKVFRGEENNVLKRYKDTADKFGGDIIMRVTGDCPLIDPTIVDNVITYFKMNNFDYIRLDVPDSFIRGFDVEIFWKESLYKAYNIVNSLEDNYEEKGFTKENYFEHVTLYMYNHREEFKVGYVKGADFYNKEYRLCVDTKEDFTLVNNIYKHFKNEYVTSKEVVEYLDKNPFIANINISIQQRV